MNSFPKAVSRRLRRWSARRFGALTVAVFALLALVFAVGAATAHDYKIGTLEIAHPWARATPGGARVGGGYLVVANKGEAADRLVSATATVSDRVEIHEMAVKDGVMTMRPLAAGLEIPAGGTVALKPGSFHLMLMGLKQPLKEGERFAGTLTFEKAGKVEVEFRVEKIAAPGADGEHDKDHGSMN
jgi:copper(I)-binding protein